MFSITVNNLSELISASESLLRSFPDERVFAFFGKMGAGKTTFIKSLCEFMGTKDTVTSPTFSIVNEYNAPEDVIYHFDFYRIKNQEEALDIGLDEYLYSGNYCFIEWPEKIDMLLPESFVNVKIDEISLNARIIRASVEKR